MLTNVKPGDCVRLTEVPFPRAEYMVGDAAIVEDVDKGEGCRQVMTVIWLRRGVRDTCLNTAWPGWELVDV